MPLTWLHKISGMIFLILAAVALFEAYTAVQSAEWWLKLLN
jgi:hypothetical protein